MLDDQDWCEWVWAVKRLCVCILPPQIAAVADMPIVILSVLPLSISFQLVV